MTTHMQLSRLDKALDLTTYFEKDSQQKASYWLI